MDGGLLIQAFRDERKSYEESAMDGDLLIQAFRDERNSDEKSAMDDGRLIHAFRDEVKIQRFGRRQVPMELLQ